MSTDRESTPQARGIRFAPALRRRIQKQAKRNHRSFSGEVLYLLEIGLAAHERETERVAGLGSGA